MTPELKERIDLVNQNKIIVFMKYEADAVCGFSNNVVQILNTLGVPLQQLIF